MNNKKGFQVYYLVLYEGTAESNLFAYLTRVKFRELFDVSSVKFSNKVEIIEDGKQIVSQGKLDGVSTITHFKAKHISIKAKYAGQRLFYFLDKDIDDSSAIEKLITHGGDIVQFVKYNTEHLLLKLDGKNPKNPSDFGNLNDFRTYCKQEFEKKFGKKAHNFRDPDFERIFNNCTDKKIRDCFEELFSILEL